jgi:hypothetical protein
MMQKDSPEEPKAITYQSKSDSDSDTNTPQENYHDRNTLKLIGKKYLKTRQLQAYHIDKQQTT